MKRYVSVQEFYAILKSQSCLYAKVNMRLAESVTFKDGWMDDLQFCPFLRAFQSYQDAGMV